MSNQMIFTEQYGQVSVELHEVLQVNNMSSKDYQLLREYLMYILGTTETIELDTAMQHHIQFYSENGVYIEPSPMSAESIYQAQPLNV